MSGIDNAARALALSDTVKDLWAERRGLTGFQSGNISTLALAASLRDTLYPEKGPLPNFLQSKVSSPACPVVVDAYGWLKDCLPGECIFDGVRRVENFIKFPEHLSFTGGDGWATANNGAVVALADAARPGTTGEQTVWKISRAAQASSIIRLGRGLRRLGRPAGKDLLDPVPHVYSEKIRKALTNVTLTAELRAYNSGGATLATQIVNIGDDFARYGIVFTPPAPKRITGISWSSANGGRLTLTCPGHGYTTGMTMNGSGSLPATNDFNTLAIASVPDANSFTIPMAVDPGAATSFGWVQPAIVVTAVPTSFAATTLGDIEVEHPYVSDIAGYPAGAICEYVSRSAKPRGRYFDGAAVDGVKYFKTTPALTLDPATGLVSEAATTSLLPTAKGAWYYPQAASFIAGKDAEALSAWTKSDASVTVTDNADACPTGALLATRLFEGAHTGEHNVQLPAGYLTNANTANAIESVIAFFAATPGGANGRDWAVITFVDRANATQRAYVNLATGDVGAVTSGVHNVDVEQLGTIGGLSYRRVVVQVATGTGATNPVLRVGLASADNTPAYAGGGVRYIDIWGVSFIGGTIQRPTGTPYGRAHHESAAVLAGADISSSVKGILGRTNITIMASTTPYFRAGRDNNVSYWATFYVHTASPQIISNSTSGGPGRTSMSRFGITWRPGGNAHRRKAAADAYTGEASQFFKFKANYAYAVGDVVIPTITQPDNFNDQNMFDVISVSGISAGEPVWPVVVTLPSATVVSGGVTFQCRHDNGINGRYESYNGAHLLPTGLGFNVPMKSAMYISTDGYGAAINGQLLERQTSPNPAHPDNRWTLPYDPETIYFGQMGSDIGIDPISGTPYGATDGSSELGRHAGRVMDVMVWSAGANDKSIMDMTR
jgi:hypothetical protein